MKPAFTHIQKHSILILLLLSLTSCASILNKRIIKRLGVEDKNTKLRFINGPEKDILFIPMHHVGRKAYYADVAHKIDSLQQLNYTVFYEGVRDNIETDSTVRKLSLMKLRKILGFFPQGHKGYLDTTTNTIAGVLKYKGAYTLINQPSYQKLKVDSTTAINGDVSLTELIRDFEKHHGEIPLDSCDYKVSFKDSIYPCKKAKRHVRKQFKRRYVMQFRNQSLAQKIAQSDKRKILVVFGEAHFSGLWYELYQIDPNYSLLKNYTQKTHKQ